MILIKKHFNKILIIIYFMFILISLAINFNPGIVISSNFIKFSIDLIKIVPAAFILIGLFQVWISRERVEKYLGTNSGKRGFIWPIILAGTTVGGLYMSLPLAYSLKQKGARYSIIFTYLGASTLVRVPMTIFEASFLGIKFTLIRLMAALPLIILSSLLLERILIGRK